MHPVYDLFPVLLFQSEKKVVTVVIIPRLARQRRPPCISAPLVVVILAAKYRPEGTEGSRRLVLHVVDALKAVHEDCGLEAELEFRAGRQGRRRAGLSLAADRRVEGRQLGRKQIDNLRRSVAVVAGRRQRREEGRLAQEDQASSAMREANERGSRAHKVLAEERRPDCRRPIA